MSEPARHFPPQETARASAPSGPLRDWPPVMRATTAEQREAELTPEPRASEPIAPPVTGQAPRLVASAETPAPADVEEPDDEIADVIAENLMLKARLCLEAERHDELQLLLAQEIRELRAHVAEEIAKLEDLRGERDLWKARCEALMQPLFRDHR